MLGSPPTSEMNAERESFGLILIHGLGLNGSASSGHGVTDHPVFLSLAGRDFNEIRLRSKGELKHTMAAPLRIASQKWPFANSVRDSTWISLGQPSSTSARLRANERMSATASLSRWSLYATPSSWHT